MIPAFGEIPEIKNVERFNRVVSNYYHFGHRFLRFLEGSVLYAPKRESFGFDPWE